MPEVRVRKMIVTVEETMHEGGPAPDKPNKRGAVLAVIKNPFAGTYVEDIQPFMKDLEPLGLDAAEHPEEGEDGDEQDDEDPPAHQSRREVGRRPSRWYTRSSWRPL